MVEIEKATIVVPTHDRSSLLEETVRSALAQPDTLLVIVDDASRDDTPRTLARLSARHPDRVRTLRLGESRGPSGARNAGLELVETAHVLFLDDDDLLRPAAIARLQTGLERCTGAQAAIGARELFRADGSRRGRSRPRRTQRVRLHQEMLTGWYTSWVAVPGQILFRVDALRRAGGWNEDVVPVEDQELLLRLSRRGDLVVIPDLVLDYRLHQAHQTRPAHLQQIEEQVRLEGLHALEAEGDLRARRSYQAGHELRSATVHYNEGDYAATLRELARACQIAPWFFASPLFGGPIRSIAVRSALRASAATVRAFFRADR